MIPTDGLWNGQGFAEVNQTRLYYEVAGAGQPLVLVHGFSLDTRMWDDQYEEFARHYEVIRYDVRGYGRSAVPGSDGYYHADDLAGLLDYLGIREAHVLGLSLGAAIATEFVLAYPGRATALIAADPVLWGYAWSPEYEGSLGALWEAGRRGGVEAARALWWEHPMFAPAREKPGVAERLSRIVSDYSGWHWTHNDPGLLPERRAAERLEEIDVPALAIVGERDVPDFHTIIGILSARIRGARKVVLPEAGHMSNMEAPGRFNDAVLRFLGGI
ncbi:MAG: alpha/beta hydrolase [Chloroflexia bacterium]